jgi:anti-sigma factor RsiW
MNKHDLLDTIQQYLDGSLPDDQRVQLEELVATDPAAATLLDECRLAFLAIRSAREEKLKDDLTQWDKET